MRILVLMMVALVSACAPPRGPVDRVGPNVTVMEPPAPAAAAPAIGPNGLPFSLRLF